MHCLNQTLFGIGLQTKCPVAFAPYRQVYAGIADPHFVRSILLASWGSARLEYPDIVKSSDLIIRYFYLD
jgi:hypothetical protein